MRAIKFFYIIFSFLTNIKKKNLISIRNVCIKMKTQNYLNIILSLQSEISNLKHTQR